MTELRVAMMQVDRGLLLSMYLPAFAPGTAYDHAALAGQVDYFVVQGYDLHRRAEERAGAVAGLEGFAYRIELDALPVVLTGTLALSFVLATVSWQVVRAARADPVDTLKLL